MKSLMIKDLAVAKEMSRTDLAAVYGGANIAILQGPTQMVGGGFSFGSPVTQVAPQNVTQTETNVLMTSVFGSANTGILQGKFL